MPDQKAGKPSLTLSEAERVRAALKRLYLERFGQNKTELGRALKRSQPAVTHLLSGTNLPSLETARRVARLEGVTVTTYLDESADDGIAENDPFPSRYRAAQSARWLLMDDWAIDRMLSEAPPPGLDSDPGPMFWFRRVEQLLATRGAPEPRRRRRAHVGNKRHGRSS
jgi:transcriptional regulator with XRE-family HTH domain